MRYRLPILALLAIAATACAATFNAGAALVNGESISLAELDRQVEAAAGATGQTGLEGEALLRQQREVLGQLIQQELIRQEAITRGIEISPEEVDQALAEIKGPFSEEEFAQQLAQAGFTEESLREQLELRSAVEAIQAELTPEVSEEELRQVYDISKSQFRQAKIRHILWQVPPGEDGAKQERQARRARTEIQAGANFGRIARQRSDDTGSAANGGRLGGWTPLSALDQSFAQGVSEATIGEVTEPVRSQFGWHLILVDARRTQPFSAVRDELRAQLEDQGRDSAFQEFLTGVADRADIVVNPRFGDWDPVSATVVPHESFEPPEPDIDPLQLPPDLITPGG